MWVVGPGTVWPSRGVVSLKDVKDPSGDTAVFVENRVGVPWLEPRDLSFAEMSFQVNDPAGVSSKYLQPAVGTVNGDVRQLAKDLSPERVRALFTIAGGERFADDDLTTLPDGRLRPPAP